MKTHNDLTLQQLPHEEGSQMLSMSSPKTFFGQQIFSISLTFRGDSVVH